MKHLIRAENSSDLGWNPNTPKDVDWIAALGIVDRFGVLEQIGSLLVKLEAGQKSKSLVYMPGQDRYKEDSIELILALEALTWKSKVMKGVRKETRKFLAGVALTEHLNPHCRRCSGAGEIKRPVGGTITCEVCRASGLHRYSDNERIKIIANGISGMTIKKTQTLETMYNEKLAPILSAFHGVLSQARPAAAGIAGKVVHDWELTRPRKGV